MVWAMMCLEAWSSEAASRSTSSAPMPSAARIATTAPAVGQRAGLVDDERADARQHSSALPPLIRTPCLAARDSPATIATGTARISGQGVATTSTATARMGSPVTSQAAPAMRDGQRQEQMAKRSASRAIGAFERCAASTSRTMPA